MKPRTVKPKTGKPETGKPRMNHRRRGTVLVAALVCLLIVIALLGSMLQGTLRIRRQLHAERDRRQTELLLLAGAQRAAFRLAAEADYRGETWKLPADNIISHGDGQVTITATREADDQPWRLSVVAEYPVGSPASIRRSSTFNIQPKKSQTQE